ncbi:flagellar filament capping protein FliD [Clostridium sp. OS1-26]|uniref:flagellar filament capping protein FliD n=1 Tax=Clostridium sp. OS1-26 TaxID=3070681 RepID=UPI0027E0ED2E|nr:flagellar filament capping protein FliD [Clostridium sp. OS1-26]WML35500.1 flagellar filament capping protein FliD [Clostridium sp. OS1-26]
MSNINRITGFSGFDVDGTIQKLMKAENAKIDKVKQDRQVIQWKQDLYREVIGNLNTFSSTYFDTLKSDTYILSSNTFSAASVTSSDTTSKINATAISTARTGTYNVTVNNVAKGASITSKSINVEQGGTIGFPIVVDNTNNTFHVNIGSNYDITLDTGKVYGNLSQMAADLNTKMSNTAVGTGKLSDNVVAVISSDGKSIQFNKKITIDDTNKAVTLNVDGKDYNITLAKGNFTTSDIAGMINGQISGLKSADGSTTFPTGVAAQSTDGQTISFINTSDKSAHAGTVTYTAGGAAVSTTLPTITGNGDTAGATGSKLNFSSNGFSYDRQIITGKNDTFSIGGATITLAAKDYTALGTSDADITADLISQINTQLTAAGVNTISARTAIDGSNKIQLVSTTSAQITLSGNASNTLGFINGSQLAQSQSDSINNLLTGQADFTINGVEFKYDFSKAAGDSSLASGYIGASGRSISSIMTEISTKANVNIAYSELTRNFTVTSRNTGVSQNFTAQDNSGTFMSTLFGSGTVDTNAAAPAGLTVQKAVDGSFTITEPGGVATTVTQSSNNFTIDGVNYKIDPSAANNSTATLNVAPNTDATLNKIKDFISKYNDLIGKINTKTDEKRQYSYKPLSDDEKKALKDQGQEDKITELENKAKQGLLKNDLTLSNMASQMRTAFYDAVKDAGINLYDIGLSTSDDTTQRGKIIIDEDKLKQALQTDGDKIAKLFTQKSTSKPYYSPTMSNTDRATRYSEEGIFQRISDIIQDSVRMSRDSQGNKGILIEKAGVQGDITDTRGLIPKQLQEKDDLIKSLTDKLSDKEDQYYKKFSAMEQALQKLNSQSQWLAQQLGGGQ